MENFDDFASLGEALGDGQDEGNEQEQWIGMSVEDKCRHVLNLLLEKKRRWDKHTGSPEIELLEDYKKEGLTHWDARETTTPTALHVLAKNRKLSAEAQGQQVLKPVVRYLLEHRDDQPPQGRVVENVQEPVLKVAILFKNDFFIDCVKDCWSEKYPDLLHPIDNNGRNCIHHIFLRNQFYKVIVKSTLPETLASKDVDGNTPIHYAMDYRLCRKATNDSYFGLVKWMIGRCDEVMRKTGEFNAKQESPYLYFQHTKALWLESIASPKVTTTTTITTETISTTITQAPEEIAEENIKKRQDPTAQAIAAEKSGAKPVPRRGEDADQGTRTPQETGPVAQPRLQKPITAPRSISVSGVQISVTVPEGFAPPSRTSTSLLETVPVTPNMSTPSTVQDQIVVPNRPKLRKPDQGTAIVPAPAQAPVQIPVAASQTPAPPKPVSAEELACTYRATTGDAIAERIGEFLKLHYIRMRTELEARELIYGKVADKNLSFDAVNHKYESASHIAGLVEKLARAGGFDNTLSSVNLPTISHASAHANKEDAKHQRKVYGMNQARIRDSLPENPAMGRTGLVEVFDKLAEFKVRRILRLQVEDREYPHHTDAAIEEALQGKQSLAKENGKRREPISIEVWDWRKPDLSTDVIAFAAPEVKEINLYWSGNATVLQAWGYALSNAVSRFKNLDKVFLHASPGLESRDRTEKQISTFKSTVHERTNKKVTVVDRLRISGTTTGPDPDIDDMATSPAGRAEGPQQHRWVAKMEDFRSALISLHKNLSADLIFNPPRVRVALIDDGVDPTKIDSYKVNDQEFVQVTGVSYCNSPWYKSTQGHGTLMANMILRINPWAKIYALKLRSASTPNGRTIYAESAAKAIEGAVEHGVDVISISWTIKNLASTSSPAVIGASTSMAQPVYSPGPSVISPASSTSALHSASGGDHAAKLQTPEMRAITALQNAISEARKAGILMFCSASDNIEAGGLDTLPYSQAPDYIFRIGAAQSLGQRDPVTEDVARINYYFPGNQVADTWNPARSAKTVEYHNGSSVATALAAGLASLIMYCTSAAQFCHAPRSEAAVRFANLGRYLRERENMRRAFDNIDSEQWQDKKYLPVWGMFGKTAADIGVQDGLKKKMEVLEELVNQLCNKVPVVRSG